MSLRCDYCRYLDAQVFAQYAGYFSFFARWQPLVFAVPLAVRLPDSPHVSVSDCRAALVFFVSAQGCIVLSVVLSAEC